MGAASALGRHDVPPSFEADGPDRGQAMHYGCGHVLALYCVYAAVFAAWITRSESFVRGAAFVKSCREYAAPILCRHVVHSLFKTQFIRAMGRQLPHSAARCTKHPAASRRT